MSYVETGNKHVKEVLKFLKKLKFKDVDGGPDFIIGDKQVDACAGHENTLLIIECTTQKDINGKINTFRGKISDIIYGFKNHPKYKRYKRHILILAVKHQKVTETHINHALKSKGPKVWIWDNKFISYYNELANSIGIFSKYSLLAEIEVVPEKKEELMIPAFVTKVESSNNLLFLFYIEPRDLLKYAYVARRQLGFEHFYQRMVKQGRLDEIKRYIEKGKIFPNSIIAALSDNSWKFSPYFDKSKRKDLNFPSWLDIGILTIKNTYKSCWIIDGQHRLFSYTKTNKPGILAVSAFANLNEERQADYFLAINREAKTVDPNLLWDLVGSLHPHSTQGIISNTVKELRKSDSSFFYENIKIPSLGSGKFSFNSICVTIEKNELAEKKMAFLYKKANNPYYNKDPGKFGKRLAAGITNFFNALNENLEEEIAEKRHYRKIQ